MMLRREAEAEVVDMGVISVHMVYDTTGLEELSRGRRVM